MYDFHNSQTPLNSIVYSTDDKGLVAIKGKWECTIECSADDITTAAISKTKYFIVMALGNVKYIYSVREWVFHPESPEKVTARFSRRAKAHRTRLSPEVKSTPKFAESELEKYFLENSNEVIDAPEPGTVALDIESGADAIAVFYGLERSQISITMRDLRQQ
ncbi:hypothetical protein [Paracidovorax oryzae]|uniref:hypothetical protein n=1 Tax=Paracidovorax oryzae TaxID=862720 RepID=UPI0035D0F4FD